MTALSTVVDFSHERFGNIRGLLIDGEPWFVGRDVASALLYVDTFGALKKHVPAKFKKVIHAKELRQMASNQETVESTPFFSDTPMGGVQRLTFINEAGFYRLVFRSKLPAAEEFTDWICETVMPTLRKTGKFVLSREEQGFMQIRDFGKDAGRKSFTEAIQVFEQRDKPKISSMYYALPTRFIQTDLCGIPKGGRDNASISQIVLLNLLESAGANVLLKAAEQGKSFSDALYDMSQTTFFLKRVYQGDVPQIGKGGTQ